VELSERDVLLPLSQQHGCCLCSGPQALKVQWVRCVSAQDRSRRRQGFDDLRCRPHSDWTALCIVRKLRARLWSWPH
jgi:hypothetical protein